MIKFFITTVLFLSSASLFGQVIYGIKGGLNLAKYSLDITVPGLLSISEASDNITSFHAGFFMRARLGSKLSIQPELMYSGQGGNATISELKLDYLNLPVMLLFHANEMITLQAGPQVGFLLGTSPGPSSEFNPVDFGVAFGLGVDLEGGVSLSFRYVLGLTNIANVDMTGAPAGTNISMTNQVMQFTFGYKLNKEPLKVE